MSVPFHISFEHGRAATAIAVAADTDILRACVALGLGPPRRVMVLVGGAGQLTNHAQLRPFFHAVLGPFLADGGITVVDGGTDAGVMQLVGTARATLMRRFDALGVAAIATVHLPGQRIGSAATAQLEPNHSHFMLVPGSAWGAEVPWISAAAAAAAGTLPSATLLVNGGALAWRDVAASIARHRPVLVLAHSGRAADTLARRIRDAAAGTPLHRLVAAGLLRVLDLYDTGPALQRALAAACGEA